MNQGYHQHLPDLEGYRRDLVSDGAPDPLPHVPFSPRGLLTTLPPPPSGRTGWPWSLETPPFATIADDWPLITIVTPSFRQGDFLEETIRSVLLQNYPNLEFVVLDGGSPDSSPAIIEKYRPWLSFSRVAPDRGQSHAINLGFSIAGGALFGWINSDDIYLMGTLRRVALAWRAGAKFIYGDLLELDQDSGEYSYCTPNLALGRYVKFAGLVLQSSSFWSSDAHQPIWEEQRCAMDYELWIRLLPGLRVRYLPHALAVARRHDDAKTYNPAMQKHWSEDAHRNALAHPNLYAKRPWLDLEYRLIQRLVAIWRRRHLEQRLTTVHKENGWRVSGI